jgi:hypothetical protein
MDTQESINPGEWFLFMADGPEQLAPFVTKPGQCQAILENSDLKKELLEASAIKKIRNKWWGNRPRILKVLGVE